MRGDRVNHIARALLRPFGIPRITPAALAVFRSLLGLGLLYILLVYQPIAARAVDVRRPHSPLSNAEWVYALALNHAATSILEVIACVAAVLFIVGVAARVAYVVVVTLMLVNVLVILARTGGHDWGCPIVTLLVLTAVPWNEAPNLAQLFRSWPAFATARLANRAYGFAIWLPGLTLGLGFAAAAYAKVVGTGIQWITNGTVRYHFVEDGRNAPVTLGLWIASHRSLAVALSLAAVIVEATFILVVFARSWRTRLAFGLMGASLMAGFTLFQGVAWWPWRILFLAFLPWTTLTSVGNRRAASAETAAAGSGTSRDLTWVHAAIVTGLVGTQLWASYRAIEIEPFISNYPMYATTFSSTEEFNRYETRARFEADGRDISDRVEAADGDNLLTRIANDNESDADANTAAQLAAFTARYSRMYGGLPASVDVVLVHRPFDFERGMYLPQQRERVGTVRLR